MAQCCVDYRVWTEFGRNVDDGGRGNGAVGLEAIVENTFFAIPAERDGNAGGRHWVGAFPACNSPLLPFRKNRKILVVPAVAGFIGVVGSVVPDSRMEEVRVNRVVVHG